MENKNSIWPSKDELDEFAQSSQEDNALSPAVVIGEYENDLATAYNNELEGIIRQEEMLKSVSEFCKEITQTLYLRRATPKDVLIAKILEVKTTDAWYPVTVFVMGMPVEAGRANNTEEFRKLLKHAVNLPPVKAQIKALLSHK